MIAIVVMVEVVVGVVLVVDVGVVFGDDGGVSECIPPVVV